MKLGVTFLFPSRLSQLATEIQYWEYRDIETYYYINILNNNAKKDILKRIL